jgi:hypothetical protein
MFVRPINNYFKGFGQSNAIIAMVCLNLSFFIGMLTIGKWISLLPSTKNVIST